MRNYNNVRGILRAKQGSQVPKLNWGFKVDLLESFYNNKKSDNPFNIDYGSLASNNLTTNNPNPYMNNDGLAVTKPSASDIKKNNQQTNNSGLGSNLVGSMIGQGADMISNMFAFDKDGYLGKYGSLQQTGDQAFDLASNAVMQINPLVGGIMKAGGLVSDVLTTYGGMGTDSMTKTDAILGSKLLSLTPVGMINGFAGKKTLQFGLNRATLEQVGSSYGGSSNLIADAASKAGKKYGLFSSGSRRRANRLIDLARLLQNTMTDIADTASDLRAMVNDLNYINNLFTLNGGYDQRYMRAAKSGMKIQDKIDFIKLRKAIHNSINLETKLVEWEPIIEDVIEEFKEGGNLPILKWEPVIEDIWEPMITDIVEEFKEGGKTKEELETPEIEETNQKNLIPEGALHKNKHHMEHTEGLTLKGIPVIDNNREQQAEIELNEIIFTLEVTKKLEELYKEGTDKAAIEAGKLLVKEILFNTDDRTGLIAKCEEGGKINEKSS